MRSRRDESHWLVSPKTGPGDDSRLYTQLGKSFIFDSAVQNKKNCITTHYGTTGSTSCQWAGRTSPPFGILDG